MLVKYLWFGQIYGAPMSFVKHDRSPIKSKTLWLMTFKCLIPGSWSIAVDFRTPLISQSFLAYWHPTDQKWGCWPIYLWEKWKYDVHTQDIQMPGIILVWSSMVFQTLKSSFWCLRSCVASSCFGFASLPARFLSPQHAGLGPANHRPPHSLSYTGTTWALPDGRWLALLLHIAMTRRHGGGPWLPPRTTAQPIKHPPSFEGWRWKIAVKRMLSVWVFFNFQLSIGWNSCTFRQSVPTIVGWSCNLALGACVSVWTLLPAIRKLAMVGWKKSEQMAVLVIYVKFQGVSLSWRLLTSTTSVVLSSP